MHFLKQKLAGTLLLNRPYFEYLLWEDWEKELSVVSVIAHQNLRTEEHKYFFYMLYMSFRFILEVIFSVS